MPTRARATLVLSEHRLETLSHAASLMREQDAVFLEEPPDLLFKPMLAGDLPLDEYVMTLETEYPAFSQAMGLVLRSLHRMGVSVFQVEPYLEHLVAIHDFFSSGGSPQTLERPGVRYEVYLMEKRATAALLDFYKSAAGGSFKDILESVKRFARIDGERFLFRDRMRAQALAPLVKGFSKSYIEAGHIHYALWRMLRQLVGDSVIVRPHFLMANAVESLGMSRHLFGPGDILTLRYIFRPNRRDADDDLLAARALIYNKLIRKNELTPLKKNPYPHIRDELEVIDAVKHLTLKACGELFSLIRKAKTETARAAAGEYLRATGRNPPLRLHGFIHGTGHKNRLS